MPLGMGGLKLKFNFEKTEQREGSVLDLVRNFSDWFFDLLPNFVLVGGLAYTAGALVYARRRPDPFPRVFGYHELFHALTLVAAGCFYAVIAFYVLPRS